MLPPPGTANFPTQQAPFLGPRNILTTDLVSYDLGGIALNDPSAGLMYQSWVAFVDSSAAGNVYIKPDNGPATLFHTIPNVTQLCLTFDQNMAPFLSFTQSGVAKFYWFDTVISGYTTTTLDAGAITPCCSLDDKRALPTQYGLTDILLFYLVGTQCLYRMQRDRYLIEYVWDSNLAPHLVAPTIAAVGMNEINCFQVFYKAAFAI